MQEMMKVEVMVSIIMHHQATMVHPAVVQVQPQL